MRDATQNTLICHPERSEGSRPFERL